MLWSNTLLHLLDVIGILSFSPLNKLALFKNGFGGSSEVNFHLLQPLFRIRLKSVSHWINSARPFLNALVDCNDSKERSKAVFSPLMGYGENLTKKSTSTSVSKYNTCYQL